MGTQIHKYTQYAACLADLCMSQVFGSYWSKERTLYGHKNVM